MKLFTSKRVAAAIVAGFAILNAAQQARAAIGDYEFQLVDPNVKVGPDSLITLRLADRRSGKPVPDAVIFATRLDMGPEGMQEMATKVTPVPGAVGGTYQFKANVSMAGGWALSLGAKIQGETGTVQGKLEFKASK
jgi:hypothetical protein